MNDLSNRPGSDTNSAPAAPEGKLIQIGGRQFRRHHARALKIQQANVQPVQLSPEASAPAPYVEPAPPAALRPAPAPVLRPASLPLPPTENQLRPRRRRRSLMPHFIKFLVLAVLPAMVGIAYYGFIATDQYVAEAQFAIRSQAQPSGDGSAASILGSPIANIGETIIVAKYLHSDQVLKDIEDDVDIRALYSVEKADWWARLDPTVTREKLLSYWTWMCTVALDPTTGIVTLSVRGFAPEDAKRITEAALHEGEKLVNQLSERARNDSLSVADAEVAKSKERVNQSADTLQKYLVLHKVIDPSQPAIAAQTRIEKLRSDISGLEAQLASMSQTMAPNSPRITVLNQSLSASQAQLAAELKKGSQNSSDDLTVVNAEVSKLSLELEFAKNAYTSALKSLELARIEAGRQIKYLEPFVNPRLPEASLYPDRPIMIGLSIGLAIFFWLMCLLIAAAVKEHL